MSRRAVAAALLALLPLLTAATSAVAQGLPFRVTIVDWESAALARQVQAYRSLPSDREVLFCVESWRSVIVSEQLERVVIEQARIERGGGTNRVSDVGGNCLDDQGRVLPMFHTHSDGNCQLSPVDLVTLVARQGAFEGIQCGPRHFVWAFAWQVLAVANSVERAALERASRRDPP
jgi:hypothetical protein